MDPTTDLIDVTFCVIDLETTGGSPTDDAICEIGAVKVCGGVTVGTFHTLVDPGRAIPVQISVITGLTTAAVQPAPPIHAVLPSLLEFIGDAVIVGHNVRFDRSFLDAALSRADHGPLANRFADTYRLARVLVPNEAENCRLGTLAHHFALEHQPTHRALDDALATTELLHVLLERAAGYGVSALDDLLDLPCTGAGAHATKLPLTRRLPRRAGIFILRDGGGRTLHVDRADDLRTHVRGLFCPRSRDPVAKLLRQAAAIDHIEVADELEAAVTEARLVRSLRPETPASRRGRPRPKFVKLVDEPTPRLSIVTRVRGGDTHLGPLPNHARARRVIDAIEAVVDRRGRSVAEVAAALSDRPDLVLGPLRERILDAADRGFPEDAAHLRGLADDFASAHRDVRRLRTAADAGRISLRLGDRRIVIDGGRLATDRAAAAALDRNTDGRDDTDDDDTDDDPAEILAVMRWLDANAHRLDLEACTGTLCSPRQRIEEPPDACPPTGQVAESPNAPTRRAMSCSHGSASG